MPQLPAIIVETVIRPDVVFQRWQYMIGDNNEPLTMSRCIGGSYYAMLYEKRRLANVYGRLMTAASAVHVRSTT